MVCMHCTHGCFGIVLALIQCVQCITHLSADRSCIELGFLQQCSFILLLLVTQYSRKTRLISNGVLCLACTCLQHHCCSGLCLQLCRHSNKPRFTSSSLQQCCTCLLASVWAAATQNARLLSTMFAFLESQCLLCVVIDIQV